MNEKAVIYICTHADFSSSVKNSVYKVADVRKLIPDDKSPSGVDGLFYSELLTYKYLADRPDELPEYVGFCHYRKYYEFMDNIPDIKSLVDKHGCITTEPRHVKPTVYNQYAKCFSFVDMDIMMAIIYNRHHWLWPRFEKMLREDWIYPCSMFIMKKQDFLEMMHLVWDCLDNYLEIIGWDVRERIINHQNVYFRPKRNCSVLENQYRLGGHLGERIISAYIMAKYSNPKIYKRVITENARQRKTLQV